MTPLVEKSISDELPEPFVIIFDGWTDSPAHFLALFVTYRLDVIYKETHIGYGSLLEDDNLSASTCMY